MAKAGGGQGRRSGPKTLEELRKTAGRPMTPEERRQQMISFVMGTMGSGSTITRKEVAELLDKQAI